jgi:hypothetical protein
VCVDLSTAWIDAEKTTDDGTAVRHEGRVSQCDDGVFTIDYGAADKTDARVIHRPKNVAEHDLLLQAMHKRCIVLFDTDRSGAPTGFRLSS